MRTKSLKGSKVTRGWNLLDARGQILGKLAVATANLLTGKNKMMYSSNIDNGDFVVIVNADYFITSGKKEDRKYYYHYTGYAGGLRKERMRDLRKRKPEDLIRKAVAGMLPRNRLHDRRLARLFIYRGSDHPYKVQLERGGFHAES